MAYFGGIFFAKGGQNYFHLSLDMDVVKTLSTEKFPDFPGEVQPFSLGSLAPSPESQELSLSGVALRC